MNEINSFRGKYAFLSNMYVCGLIDNNGKMYRSVEHYYQSHKIRDACERYPIESAKTPIESKKLGRSSHLRSDWGKIKDNVMEKGLRLKFENEYLKEKLISTHPYELIEGNWWGDTYWGKVDGEGENKLGILLMKLRDEFSNENGNI